MKGRALKLPALEKLRFSKRQEFFWIKDAELLALIRDLPPPPFVPHHAYRDKTTGKDITQQEYTSKLLAERRIAVSHREDWTEGDYPPSVLATLPAGIPGDKIKDFCVVVKSQRNAMRMLADQTAGWERKSDGLFRGGPNRYAEKSVVKRLVQGQQSTRPFCRALPNPAAAPEELRQSLDNPPDKPLFHDAVARVLKQAIDDDDMPYLRSVFRKQAWKGKVHDVTEFLVDFWCGPPCIDLSGAQHSDRDSLAEPAPSGPISLCHPNFPPLCFFTDDALAAFCGYALETDEKDFGRTRRNLLEQSTILARRIREVHRPAEGLILLK